jgi:membrane-associated phospholipid phosphatase
MLPSSAQADPSVARASSATWWAWVCWLVTRGRERLAALGLTLVAGFVVGLLVLYAFAHLADEVMEHETQQLDNLVLHTLRQFSSPPLDALAYFVSFLGSEVVVVLLVALVLGLALHGRWGAATGLVVTTLGAQLLNNFLKEWFHRIRPAPVDWAIAAQVWSFPSGHAMVSAAFYLFLAYLGWRVLHGRERVIFAAGLLGLVVAIGLSRLYLGVHYLTDVVAGYAAGFLWTDAVIIGAHVLGQRRRKHATAVIAADSTASARDGSGNAVAGSLAGVDTRLGGRTSGPDGRPEETSPSAAAVSSSATSPNGRVRPH